MTGIIVGSVGVTVYPETRTFWSRFKAQTTAGANEASRDLGQALSRQLPSQVSGGVTRGLQQARVQAGRQGSNAGTAFGDSFGRQVSTRIEAALRALPTNITVDANTDPALRRIAQIKQGIAFQDFRLGVTGDTDTFQAELAKIRTELGVISRTAGDMRVRIDATEAHAEISKLLAEIQGVSDAVGDSGDGGGGGGGSRGGSLGRRLRLLLNVIAFIGPALIPIGAAVAPAFGAMAVLAGVAALAIYGLVKGLDPLAKGAVNDSLNQLNIKFIELSGSTARAIAPGLISGIDHLTQAIPGVQVPFDALALTMGYIADNVGQGLVSLIIAFIPLASRAAEATLRWSQGFADVGQSDGFTRFLDYAQSVLPEVGQALGALGDIISHIVQAFAPWGSIVLGGIIGLSVAIDAIPVPVLQALALIFESYLAYKLVGTILTGIALGLERLAFAAAIQASTAGLTATSSALASFGIAGGPATLAIVGVTAALVAGLFVWQQHSKRVAEARERVASYTQALREDNGVIGENTRLTTYNNLSSAKAFEISDKLGIARSTVVDAALGNAGALSQLTAAQAANNSVLDEATKKNSAYHDPLKGYTLLDDINTTGLQDNTEAYANLLAIIGSAGGELTQSQKDFLTLNAAVYGATQAVTALKVVFPQLSAELGISSGAVESYAANLGYSGDASARVAPQVINLANSYKVANSAQTALLDATIAYAGSAGSAADQAAYLGAVLVASQGDVLGVAGAFASAYGATQSFVDQVKGDSKLQAGLAEMANKLIGVNLATADMSTYSDIFSSASAPAITSALAGIQTNASTAAQAWYQHQVGIVGTEQAAQEATALFQGQTHDALVALAGQLGLSEEQAGALADNLLRTPEKTPIEIIAHGLDEANETLQILALTMANLTRSPHDVYVTYHQLTDAQGADPGSAAAFRIAEQRTSGESKHGGIYNPTVGHYADGAHVAGIFSAQPHNRIFAEPETGGEAYIPMHLNKRSRSTAILDQVAGRFGYELTPKSAKYGRYASGGINFSPQVSIQSTGGSDSGLINEIRALRAQLAQQTDALVGATYGAAEEARRTAGMGAR